MGKGVGEGVGTGMGGGGGRGRIEPASTYVMPTLQLAKPETEDGTHVFLYAYVLPTLQLS